MDARQVEHLSETEYEAIGKALWELVKQYPRQPCDPDVIAQYDFLDAEHPLAVFVLGGTYKSRDITGGFTAEIRFRVAYGSLPDTSEQRINAQAFVGRILSWLEEAKDLPLLAGGRKVTEITASDTVPYRKEKKENEMYEGVIYVADAVMQYRKRGE